MVHYIYNFCVGRINFSIDLLFRIQMYIFIMVVNDDFQIIQIPDHPAKTQETYFGLVCFLFKLK